MNKLYYIFIVCMVFLMQEGALRAQWVKTGPSGSYVYSLAVDSTNLFAGTEVGVFLSTNNGTSWTAVNTGLTNTGVLCLAVNPNGIGGTNLFAGTGVGVFLSTNNGTSWSAVNTGLPNSTRVYALAVSGTNLFAGTDGGAFLSTNNGTSWTTAGLNNNNVYSLATDSHGTGGINLFAGTGVGVFLSTNNGTNWTTTGLRNTGVLSLVVSSNGTGGTNLFAGGGGVFLSTNNGTNWGSFSSPLTNILTNALAVSGKNLFAGTWGKGVFLSTNNGTSWTAVNTGLIDTIVASFAVSGTNLFAGTYGGGVWRRPLSEMVTSVREVFGAELPIAFSLEQNYPNPFNPNTTIEFRLPRASFVRLEIYNMLAEKVAELVSKELNAGTYRVEWDAKGIASGIYVYRLTAGSFVETKKLVLLK